MTKSTPSRLMLVVAIGLGTTLAAGLARSRRSHDIVSAASRVAPWQPLIDAGRRATIRRSDSSTAIELDEINMSQADETSENALIDGFVSAPTSDV